jgi:hypothetical protein
MTIWDGELLEKIFSIFIKIIYMWCFDTFACPCDLHEELQWQHAPGVANMASYAICSEFDFGNS